MKSRQILYQIWHYYSNMVDVMTFSCVLLHVRVSTFSFLALQGKRKSFGFQDIAIDMKLLTKYVMPDTLPK